MQVKIHRKIMDLRVNDVFVILFAGLANNYIKGFIFVNNLT